VAEVLLAEELRERREDDDAAQVVVREGRVAHGRREKEEIAGGAVQRDLPVRDVAVFERRVDADAVASGLEPVHDPLRGAEPPALGPVRRAVRDDVWVARVGEQVLAKLVQVDLRVDRRAVSEEVQRRICDVDDARSVRRSDPGLADVPLPRQRPVEDLCAGRQLDGLDGHLPSEPRERLSHTVPREAARDRKELAHEGVELLTDDVGLGDAAPVDRHRRGGIRGARTRKRTLDDSSEIPENA
jgi:hypothetical protein